MDRLPLTLAPDGSALVMEGIDRAGKPALEYAALAVRGKRVVVTPRYAVSQKPRYLDEQGTLYCVSGAVYGPDGVLIREAPSTVVTPLLLFHAFSPVEYHGSRVAVLRPRIGQRWYVPRLADRQLAAASRDGRFVLTYETGRHGRPMPGLLRWAAARLPSLEDAWQRRHSAPRLCVYQAPGRLRARLNLQEGNEILELPAFDEKRLVQTLPFGYDISFDELYLSPNGRRAVVQCRGREGGRQFLVLGW